MRVNPFYSTMQTPNLMTGLTAVDMILAVVFNVSIGPRVCLLFLEYQPKSVLVLEFILTLSNIGRNMSLNLLV